jgi:hypothetical protein
MNDAPKEPPLSRRERVILIVGLVIVLIVFGGPVVAEFIGAYLR